MHDTSDVGSRCQIRNSRSYKFYLFNSDSHNDQKHFLKQFADQNSRSKKSLLSITPWEELSQTPSLPKEQGHQPAPRAGMKESQMRRQLRRKCPCSSSKKYLNILVGVNKESSNSKCNRSKSVLNQFQPRQLTPISSKKILNLDTIELDVNKRLQKQHQDFSRLQKMLLEYQQDKLARVQQCCFEADSLHAGRRGLESQTVLYNTIEAQKKQLQS